MAGKQAKILSKVQVKTALLHLQTTRNPLRDQVMFLLSFKSGLRAKEIANLTWQMVLDSDGEVGEVMNLENRAAKMGSGREIPLNRDLRSALVALHNDRKPKTTDFVIYSERGTGLSANVVAQWFLSLYQKLGYVGCSSHSGRRTFITTAARQIGTVGGSLRDVQQMAGHQSLQMTAAYIEGSSDAKRKLVNQI